jgi:hypothetical protein
MTQGMGRMEFIKLMGLGGLVFASGIKGYAQLVGDPEGRDFFFAQLSDTHWGFQGPKINPDAAGTLEKAVEAVNGLARQPDFIMFTGDLTHDVEDPDQRRQRMREFRSIISRLKVKDIRFIPGEHDAGADQGKAFRELFGETHYTFDHKGIHFIALDNVSVPGNMLGKPQMDWLAADLAALKPDQPIVVFAHRPLFDLYEQWDWTTDDGDQAIALLQKRRNVTVFYGHIHQEHHQMTGAIAHHAARSLIFPLPSPGSQPKRAPVPWDPAEPYRGLGLREVELRWRNGGPPSGIQVDTSLQEFPVVRPKA